MTRTLTVLIATLLLALSPVSADASARPVLGTSGTPVGIVVTGPNGHAVYRFDLDHRGAQRSACTGACLRVWRPVTFAGTARTRVRVVGLTARASSIPAAHHRRQVTVAGWPVYYYVGDTAPGQVNGHGSGGVWWPVAPDGSRVRQIPVDKPVGTTPGPTPGTSYTLTTRSVAAGTVVTTGGGRTVYRFDQDTQNDATSACTGACRYLWTPVTASGAPTASGVSGAVAAAPDGQVTLDGWRVYTYAGDSSAGDTHGQGIGMVWWMVAPSGAEVKG